MLTKSPLTEEALKELAALGGTWTFNDFHFDGKKTDFVAYWVFKDNTVAEHLDSNVLRCVGIVAVDPTKSPKTIDINFVRGTEARIGMFQGIYELDGDTLKVCLGTEKGRPTEMASAEGSKNLLIVFKRKK
jgi:uncharacterized protein (TIGR03067 family)